MIVRALAPAETAGALADLARLRIAVFRDWPYLYDGDPDYEERYLATLAKATGHVIVGAFEDGRLVGAATGAPMAQEDPAFSAPFRDRGAAIDDLFYCAESVLLPAWRGRGIGHAFFDHREAHARALGYRRICFCGVIRPDDHPARPAGYRPLDAFWRKRGYAPVPGAMARYSWRDVGDDHESEKSLQFWMRDL